MSTVDSGAALSGWQTLRRGLAYSPELTRGLPVTALLAVVASLGQVLTPIAIQQTLDRGVGDVGFTVLMVSAALGGLLITSAASYLMTARLFRSAEEGLATLRIKAFRHLHELPLLTQQSERRGALVSRVTSDVDQVSQFLVFGGLVFVVSIGQMLVGTLVMLVYSWELTLVVWLCFAPLFWSIRYFQRRLSLSYGRVRTRVGQMLSAISEPVVGAGVVRSYGVQDRTQQRIDASIAAHQRAATRALSFSVVSFSLGGVTAGVANAAVLVIGILLGIAGRMSAGEVLAFMFLVTLFVSPVQIATQILNDAQNAFAGWRRVIGILTTPADLVDPGEDGVALPQGALDVAFDGVGFAYPAGPPVLHDVRLALPAGARVAVVGGTGSGKSTLAKLLTRLMDPDTGTVRVGGVDLRTVREASLRRSVVLVPQEGFLFDDTLRSNVRYGDLGADDARILAAAEELGLGDWIAGLPAGLDTGVGQRGESLSAGERQLVALLRAHLAGPDLLVLDEATSAVDPQLEVRIAAALERLTAGRTSVTIAHRLSTAEAADEVVVMDAGRVVQQGPHAALLAEADGVYAGLYASWIAQQDQPGDHPAPGLPEPGILAR